MRRLEEEGDEDEEPVVLKMKAIEVEDGDDTGRSGRNGDRQTACVMFVQSFSIMLAVWMTTCAVSSWRRSTIILE